MPGRTPSVEGVVEAVPATLAQTRLVRGTWPSMLACASPTSNNNPLGKGFGPAGADCGFREPLAPRLARPGPTMVARPRRPPSRVCHAATSRLENVAPASTAAIAAYTLTVSAARSELTSDVPPATNASSNRPGKKRDAGAQAS